MGIQAQHISYTHANGQLLFDNISFNISTHEKVSLIGDNGSGKSTLLRILSGLISDYKGDLICSSKPYYIPQHFGQLEKLTVAEALHIHHKLDALRAILDGNTDVETFDALADDWTIQERSLDALKEWDLPLVNLHTPLSTLSGGEKTRVFLAGITIHQPDILLLDEPTNHLDTTGRNKLYQLIEDFKGSIIVVSHDKKLLNLQQKTFEISKNNLRVYGGNYNFYQEAKNEELTALTHLVKDAEKDLKLAKKQAQLNNDRMQKQQGRNQKLAKQGGIPKIIANGLASQSEKNMAIKKEQQQKRQEERSNTLSEARTNLGQEQLLSFRFPNTAFPLGKALIEATQLQIAFGTQNLWKSPLDVLIKNGERIAIQGKNGSGKSTLIKALLGETNLLTGQVKRAAMKWIYLDQSYTPLHPSITVFEQLQNFNLRHLEQHILKQHLVQYKLPALLWDNLVDSLSGGEKLKLLLCCLNLANENLDLIVLDEPSNNMDIKSLNQLIFSIKSYKGAIIVVSHDEYFLNDLQIDRIIQL
ncbi:ATP-binding cassette domain-containing protein [Pseudopedobacter beijingensis]|uniref:ATP-binding cassette domain-containing protein n=1 Tax=Pseudopedobacter beijingensis TaxID=1207056 RepID=A0ABW4IBS3_9SPHI